MLLQTRQQLHHCSCRRSAASSADAAIRPAFSSNGSSGSSRAGRCRANATQAAPDADQLYTSSSELQSYVGPVTPIRLKGESIPNYRSRYYCVCQPGMQQLSSSAAKHVCKHQSSSQSINKWYLCSDDAIISSLGILVQKMHMPETQAA
jgi:hypothetical protein